MREHIDFWRLTRDALDYAMAHCGLDDAALFEKLMQAYLSLDAFNEVQPVLELLNKSGIPCAILTNGSPMMIDAAVSSAGLDKLIQNKLSIESVGIYKPDPRVYQLACDELSVAPSSIAFQSSNAWDAAGAANFGFQVAWVNRYGQPAERLPGTPTAEIADLNALPGLVGVC
jgi:2-haloacid dehalogenase